MSGALARVTESQIVKIWQHQLWAGTELASEKGEPLSIIYPGRINDDRGADFRDAVIATKGQVIKGDIEVHVKSSDWQAHQHHCDPRYNQVILHVVMWHDLPTKLQNGNSVPVLAVHKYLRSHMPDLPATTWATPCRNVTNYFAPDEIAKFLDRAGEERFLAKATSFQQELAQTEAVQCLYQGIMQALGYTKNKLPCSELACRLPFRILEQAMVKEMSEEERLVRVQALLLGTGGLLASQRRLPVDEPWVEKLERAWATIAHPQVMSLDDWHLFKVRPNNFPVRRLAAMSYLLCRYRNPGILAIVDVVKTAPLNSGHSLGKGLVVIATGYWTHHFDFGSDSRRENPTLLGCNRAADIIVNVLLPFTFAWSQLTSQPELGEKACELYRRYPKLAVNAVERHMRNQLRLDQLVNSARRQQGLLHIYNSLCRQGRCGSCSLGQLEAGENVQS